MQDKAKRLFDPTSQLSYLHGSFTSTSTLPVRYFGANDAARQLDTRPAHPVEQPLHVRCSKQLQARGWPGRLASLSSVVAHERVARLAPRTPAAGAARATAADGAEDVVL